MLTEGLLVKEEGEITAVSILPQITVFSNKEIQPEQHHRKITKL